MYGNLQSKFVFQLFSLHQTCAASKSCPITASRFAYIIDRKLYNLFQDKNKDSSDYWVLTSSNIENICNPFTNGGYPIITQDECMDAANKLGFQYHHSTRDDLPQYCTFHITNNTVYFNEKNTTVICNSFSKCVCRRSMSKNEETYTLVTSDDIFCNPVANVQECEQAAREFGVQKTANLKSDDWVPSFCSLSTKTQYPHLYFNQLENPATNCSLDSQCICKVPTYVLISSGDDRCIPVTTQVECNDAANVLEFQYYYYGGLII